MMDAFEPYPLSLDGMGVETLTETVEEFAVATGVPYVSLPMVNVLQLDNLDDGNVVYLQRSADGDLILRTRPTKWM